MASCRGFWECLLKVLNFFLILVGLAMIGYGVYLFVEYQNVASTEGDDAPISPSSGEYVQLGRPMLLAVSLGDSILDKLPKAWFIYLFTGIGAMVLFIACCGCIGTSTRNGCCLTYIKYSMMMILLILVELGLAAFIFFDKSWKEEIPTDKTGNFDIIYKFLEKHWKIIRWVALGAVTLEAFVFLLALVARAANIPAEYDSDEEYIGAPRQQIRQPLINRPVVPATGVPVAGTLDQRPSRNDAWSTRMREKYGLDTSEFTYNPSESNRYHQQAATQPSEEGSRCTIM
ncbi:Tobamovirus multiplication protein 2A [Orobanche gracilis]